MLTAILPAATFAIVGGFAYSQYRKMKGKPQTEPDAGVHAAQHLQQMDHDREHSDPAATTPVSQRTPRSERGTQSAVD